jgi:formiminotetrahydrofolate cyclodeaminase
MSEPTGQRVLGAWLEELASDAPTPGGGPAAAVVAATGAALISMVGRLTIGREQFAEVEPRMREIVARADDERGRFLELAGRDEEVFEGFMAALRMARDTEEQKLSRAASIQAASVAAADVPLEIAQRAVGSMELAREVAAAGNPQAASDGACAAACLHAAAHAALASVRINAASMADEATRSRYLAEARELKGNAGRLLAEADDAFSSRLSS